MKRLHIEDLCEPTDIGSSTADGHPLGLRDEVAVTLDPQALAALEHLDKTSFAVAVKAVGENTGDWDPADLARELKRLFALHLLVDDLDRSFVPTAAVDAVWHELILDTLTYRNLCQRVFGTYLDHVPEHHYDPGTGFAEREAARDTVVLLRWAFGALHPVWSPLQGA